MRVPVYQLVTKEVDNIDYIKVLLLLPDLGIEQHVQKHVAEFLRKFMLIACQDGSVELVHFFNSLRTERLIGLLPVPWAFLPKFVQHIQNPSECLHFFFSSMHNAKVVIL